MSKKSTNDARANSKQKPTRFKVMKECLKVAAKIRQELEDRRHSNSTELGAEDRQR